MRTTGAGGVGRYARATLQAFVVFFLAFVSTGGPVRAFENGSTFMLLPGMSMGIPYAYVGPPGIYANDFASYGTNTLPRDAAPNAGKGPGSVHVDATIELLALRWTTPWTLLGASFAAQVIQPVVTQDKYGEIPGKGAISSFAGGIHDTIVAPAILSWQFPQKFYVAAALRLGVPDGTIQGVNGLDNIGVPYWMIQPTFAVAYLNNGWDLAANFFYDIYTTNPYSRVTDGQVFRADLTATKKFGRFEIGPVGYLAFQTTRDTGGASPAAYIASHGALNTCEPLPSGAWDQCSRGGKAGVGGEVAYDFDGAKLAVLVTDSVYSHGVGGANGWRVWTQAAFKLYTAPPPAPPLAAPGGMITK